MFDFSWRLTSRFKFASSFRVSNMSTIEEHEYNISGMLVVRKTVYDDSEDGALWPKIREEYTFGKVIVGVLALTTVIIAVLAILVFQPTATKNCSEQSECDNIQPSLDQCKATITEVERDLNTTRKQNKELSTNNTKIAEEKNELSKNLTVLEGDIKSLNDSLESAKQREEELQDENKTLRDKKDKLFKDLDDTKYKLGSCKNKNMDHEVRSMELLEEIEGLKKELKACK